MYCIIGYFIDKYPYNEIIENVMVKSEEPERPSCNCLPKEYYLDQNINFVLNVVLKFLLFRQNQLNMRENV